MTNEKKISDQQFITERVQNNKSLKQIADEYGYNSIRALSTRDNKLVKSRKKLSRQGDNHFFASIGAGELPDGMDLSRDWFFEVAEADAEGSDEAVKLLLYPNKFTEKGGQK
ncbi:hypothetical protein OSG_eHP35_00070 [environmental Halophage eHP-35]|nr:hypothetical protein OSG_eHP35_00070 [environmental Halophage eHP-35]